MSEKHVQALLFARGRIESGNYVYICNALPINFAGRDIRIYIMAALEGRQSLDCWLDIRGFKVNDPEKLRETRLAWIDYMIELWRNEP